jgi:hypothetical protein
MQTEENRNGNFIAIAKAFAGVALGIALVVFMIVGEQKNAMLRSVRYFPMKMCQYDPAHFTVVDMKIDRCVRTDAAARWTKLANIANRGLATYAILFAALFVPQFIRKRRDDKSNDR